MTAAFMLYRRSKQPLPHLEAEQGHRGQFPWLFDAQLTPRPTHPQSFSRKQVGFGYAGIANGYPQLSDEGYPGDMVSPNRSSRNIWH